MLSPKETEGKRETFDSNNSKAESVSTDLSWV